MQRITTYSLANKDVNDLSTIKDRLVTKELFIIKAISTIKKAWLWLLYNNLSVLIISGKTGTMPRLWLFSFLFILSIINPQCYAQNPNFKPTSKQLSNSQATNTNKQDLQKLELLNHLKKVIFDSQSFEDRFDAEVWLLSKSTPLARYVKNPEKRLSLLIAIHREATLANLDPNLVLAVIQIESAFDPFALSHVGAQGIMQVMPFWKNEIGRPEDNLMHTDTNLRYGCTILKFYLDKEKGNMRRALARYNGSLGSNRYPEKVLTAWTERWR